MARGRTGKGGAAAGGSDKGDGANLGFEAKMFLAADKLRKNLEPSDYKHVALGLIFLKYISNAFEAKREALLADDPSAAEDPDEYLAVNVFWVPKEARWSHLQASAKLPTIGTDDEIAFYDALAENDSARQVMGEPALRLIAHELVTVIKANMTIDWMHRAPARAKIRVHVKRLLKKYGLPARLAG